MGGIGRGIGHGDNRKVRGADTSRESDEAARIIPIALVGEDCWNRYEHRPGERRGGESLFGSYRASIRGMITSGADAPAGEDGEEVVDAYNEVAI